MPHETSLIIKFHRDAVVRYETFYEWPTIGELMGGMGLRPDAVGVDSLERMITYLEARSGEDVNDLPCLWSLNLGDWTLRSECMKL